MLMHNLPWTIRLVALLLATCGVLCEGMAQADGFCCDPNYPQSYDPFNCTEDNIPDNDCLPSGCTNPDAFNYDDEAGWDDGTCYTEADLPLAGPMPRRRRRPRSWATSPSMAFLWLNLVPWLPFLRMGCVWGGPFPWRRMD